jgi:Family of unknown function (DUF5670)
MLQIVKKLARTCTLPYPLIADLRGSASVYHPARSWRRKEVHMLWTIVVILLVLWLLGLVSAYTLGGFIHVLLVIAVVVLVIRLMQGRPPV